MRRAATCAAACVALAATLWAGCGVPAADARAGAARIRTDGPPAPDAARGIVASPDHATREPPGAAATGAASAAPLPRWLADAAVLEWRAVPGSRLDRTPAWTGYRAAAGNTGKTGLFAYSGGALKPTGSEFFVAGGGHLDYAGNEIFSIALGDDAPAWVRRIDPSRDTPKNTPYYPDGRPSARHTYRSIAYVAQRERLMFFGGSPFGDRPMRTRQVDGFDPVRNAYDPEGTWPSAPVPIGGPDGTGLTADGDFVMHNHRDNRLYRWRQRSATWEDLGDRGPMHYETPYAVDTRRNRLFRVPWQRHGARLYDLERDGAPRDVTLGGPDADAIVAPAALVYDPVNDAFWTLNRGDATLYRIDARSFEVTRQPATGTPPALNARDVRHRLYGRFAYAPALRAIVVIADPSSEVRVIRTAP